MNCNDILDICSLSSFLSCFYHFLQHWSLAGLSFSPIVSPCVSCLSLLDAAEEKTQWITTEPIYRSPPIPPPPQTSLRPVWMTLASPWYHDWPGSRLHVSLIGSCQSVVLVMLWQGRITDSHHLPVYSHQRYVDIYIKHVGQTKKFRQIWSIGLILIIYLWMHKYIIVFQTD